MNYRFVTTLTLLSCSALFLSGCGDIDDLRASTTSGTQVNNGLIAQNNFTLLFSPTQPKYVDTTTTPNTYTAVTSEITVQIGDIKNQLITGGHVINFRTEWGLIEPSCTTEDGSCSVTWRSGSPDNMPANNRNTILAYASTGQESFADLNGNGLFDDGDTFASGEYADMQEPFINVDESVDAITGLPSFTTGDIIVDTINGVDLTGVNATHDAGDTKFNGPNCSHTTLCSTTRTTITVWESGSLLLTGPPVVTTP